MKIHSQSEKRTPGYQSIFRGFCPLEAVIQNLSLEKTEKMNEALLLIIGPVAASFATWLFAMRKSAAEANSKELDNTAKIVLMWRELSEGMEKRFKKEIDQLRKDNCDLEQQVKNVVQENEALRKKMHLLEEENRKLISQLKIFNKKNSTNE